MSWRGHMFGVAVDSSCELVGCSADQPTSAALPELALRPASPDEIARSLPGGGVPLTWRPGGHEPDLLHHQAGGYRLEAPGMAGFHITPGGETVRYAPASGPDWRWQRYLLGRVLPLAVTLLGREPLHASGVACGKSAVLLAGESGSGKTTLATELMLAGLGFMADDVVALSLEHGRAVAHPGPGLISLRGAQRFGELVGADREGRWVAIEREPHPLPVGALYLLEAGGPTGITPMDSPRPVALLAASFNLAVRDPVRLTRQLDVCAALSRVRVARVGIPHRPDFGALADALLGDLYGREVAA